MLRFGLRLFVREPDETALDPDGTIVIEDHERTAARDVVAVVRLPLGFQPLDLGLKFAEPCIHFIGKFVGRLVLFGEPVEFRLYHLKGCLILRRKLDRMRVGAAHAMSVREIEMGSLRSQRRVSGHFHQPIASTSVPGSHRSRFAQPIATKVGTTHARSVVRLSEHP